MKIVLVVEENWGLNVAARKSCHQHLRYVISTDEHDVALAAPEGAPFEELCPSRWLRPAGPRGDPHLDAHRGEAAAEQAGRQTHAWASHLSVYHTG